MNALFFFSPNCQSKIVNDYYKEHFPDFIVFDLTDYLTRTGFDFTQIFDYVIITIPVYSQNIPKFLKRFFKNINTKYAVINIIYGSISPGNCLKKISSLFNYVIAGSIICSKHCYIDTEHDLDLAPLVNIIEKINSKTLTKASIPNHKKNPFSNLFIKLRSRLNIKIIYDNTKCNNCNKCIYDCPINAIKEDYKRKNSCLRCLKCVNVCPNQAYTFKKSKILVKYLNSKSKLVPTVIYL